MAIEMQGIINELLEGSIKTVGKVPVINELNVVENGIYTPPSGVDGFAPINVNVPIPTFSTIPLNATANGEYTPPSGIDGFSKVNVNITEKYILNDITVALNSQYIKTTNYENDEQLINGNYYFCSFIRESDNSKYNTFFQWNDNPKTIRALNYDFTFNANNIVSGFFAGNLANIRCKLTEINNDLLY